MLPYVPAQQSSFASCINSAPEARGISRGQEIFVSMVAMDRGKGPNRWPVMVPCCNKCYQGFILNLQIEIKINRNK